ncbi:MAG: hypothetical protein K8R59_18115 [Thermoanaerobaculales bacterium]|nr:hypothetical protein [Thermoanaerobaculales bacterium]
MNRNYRLVLSLFLVMVLAAAGVTAQERPSELPDLKDTGVVVPWSDFKVLLEDLKRIPVPTPVPPPPVDHAFSECRITAVADAEEERLQVEMAFTVQVLDDERWVEIRVAPADLALDRVSMDGAPARLYRKGSFQCVAVRGRGRHSFDIRALVPVVRLRGRWTASLRYPPAPVVSLNIEVPGADRVIEVEGGVVRSLEATRDGRTRLSAALTNSGGATVGWFSKIPTDAKESTVFADVASLLVIGEGNLRGNSIITYTIHGQGVSHFELELPAEIAVIDVSGQGVTEWKLSAAEENRQRLSVALAFPAEGAYSFEIEFERALEGADTAFELPDIVLEGVRRERGYLAVAAATNVEITPGDSISNAAAVDPSEMPPSLAARAGSDVLYLFKYLRHPVVIPLTVIKHEDLLVKRTIVERARLSTFVNPQGRRLSSAVFRVKNNRKQFLAVSLPEGATLWGAFREGKPVKAALREDGAVLVPLKKMALGRGEELRPFDVEVTWFEEGRPSLGVGGYSFEAPALDVDILDLQWKVFLPRQKRYFAFGGTLEMDPVGDLQVVNGLVYRFDKGSAVGAGKVTSLDEDKEYEGQQLEAEESTQRFLSQVTQSNVANLDYSAIQGVGGRARGVLPVRVVVPEVGLELGFSGRLVVADEASTVTMILAPAAWRSPRFGRGSTAFLAFLLTLAGGLAIVFEADRRRLWLFASGLLLILFFLASAQHRTAFVVGFLLAAAAAWILRWFRNREPAVEDGF